MVIRELVTLLGFDIEDKKLEQFDKSVDETKNRLLAMGAAVVAASASIFYMVKQSANAADEIKRIAMTAGVSETELQKMGYAAQIAGASLDEVGVGFKFLNKNAQEAAKDASGEVGKEFRKLGVQVKDANGHVRSASDLFLELNQRFQNLDPGQRAATALKLLGKSGGGLVEMLSESPDKIRQLMSEAEAFGGILSHDDIENLGDFNDGIDRTVSLMGFLRNTIALAVAPEIIGLMNTFREWMVVNKDIIKQNLVGFFLGLTKVLKVVWLGVIGLMSAFNRLIDIFGIGERTFAAFFAVLSLLWASATIAGISALITAVTALGSAFFIAWLKATLPIALIIAGIGLIILALEDMYTYFTDGGDSFTGDLAEKLKEIWESLKDMAQKEGVTLGQILGDAIANGVMSALGRAVPGGFRLLYDVIQALPGMKAMNYNRINSMIDTESWRNRTPTIPNSSINNNTGGTTVVNANTTVNVPAGTDPSMVGDRVESGVGNGLQSTLRTAGRASAPALGY